MAKNHEVTPSLEEALERKDHLRHLFSDGEAATYLRMSKVSLWRARRAGRINFLRIAGKIFYTSDDLDKYLNVCRNASPDRG